MSPLARPPRELRDFPALLLRPDRPLSRIHRAGYSPWWFSSGGLLRFDLTPPRGTCYLAVEAAGAFIEAFQDWSGTILPAAEVLARRVSTLFVPSAMRLADCTNPRALAFGVTAEIHSSPDRILTQQWATAFAEAGFAGVRFFVRHDPAQRRTGIALFGQAGEVAWPIESTSVIAAQLILDVEDQFGIRVQ